MRLSFTKLPIDIIYCLIWSLFYIPVASINTGGIIQILWGIPLVLFIPGYLLTFALFPSRKTKKGIDVVERIALSFGLSLAILPLIGFILNFTALGIQLEPLYISVLIFTFGAGIFAVYRWVKTPVNDRFVVALNVSRLKNQSKVEKVLTLLLIIVIIIAVGSLVYVLTVPTTGERFTEFYLLGSDGVINDYSWNITAEENVTITLGVVNHEYRVINYTIEIWLINQTFVINEDENTSEVLYNHMWFIDKLNVVLEHVPVVLEDSWKAQWEYDYMFSIGEKGEDYRLVFLLFAQPTGEYNREIDYVSIVEQKMESAYLETYLFLNVV